MSRVVKDDPMRRQEAQGYDYAVMVWSPEYAPEWWRYPETIE